MTCSTRVVTYHLVARVSACLHCRVGLNWRKLAPVPILALVTEYCELADEQVVVLFQILAAEINFGYKFQTVKCALSSASCLLASYGQSQQLQLHCLVYGVGDLPRGVQGPAAHLVCHVITKYWNAATALCRCEKFNGQELHSLKQLAEAVDNCKWVLLLLSLPCNSLVPA